jgi:hypothetical protein
MSRSASELPRELERFQGHGVSGRYVVFEGLVAEAGFARSLTVSPNEICAIHRRFPEAGAWVSSASVVKSFECPCGDGLSFRFKACSTRKRVGRFDTSQASTAAQPDFQHRWSAFFIPLRGAPALIGAA